MAADINRTIDAVWRIESPKLIAGLARLVRDPLIPTGLSVFRRPTLSPRYP